MCKSSDFLLKNVHRLVEFILPSFYYFHRIENTHVKLKSMFIPLYSDYGAYGEFLSRDRSRDQKIDAP